MKIPSANFGRTHRHWKTAVLLLSIMLMAATVVSAQKLTVWVGDGETRLREYEVVASLFEEQHPGVTVEVISQAGNQTQVMQKILLAIISGAPPDAMWLEGSGVIEFAAQGLLMDLTEALEGLNFAPSDTQEMMYDSRMWGVPYHTASRGLFKRVDFFDQVGMDASVDPRDLDEFYAWNQKLAVTDSDGNFTRAGYMPWVGNWGSPAWIWTFGGDLLEVEGTVYRPTANRRENIAAFEWIRNWAQMYNGQTPVTGGTVGFEAGSTAMSAESTSVVNRFRDANVPFVVGRVPHPEGGRNGTWGGGTAVGVPSNAPNPEWSLKLARFFGETETQLKRFEQTPNVLPANWEALLEVGVQLPAEFGPLLEQLPEARPRTPLWIDYYVNSLNPQMNQVVAGNITAAEALDNVQRVMEVRFAEVFGN